MGNECSANVSDCAIVQRKTSYRSTYCWGVHPKLGLDFFADLLSKVRELIPEIHIKAFTAVELDYMFRKAKKLRQKDYKF